MTCSNETWLGSNPPRRGQDEPSSSPEGESSSAEEAMPRSWGHESGGDGCRASLHTAAAPLKQRDGEGSRGCDCGSAEHAANQRPTAALQESKEQAPRQLEFSESSINRKAEKCHLRIVDRKVRTESGSTGKTKTAQRQSKEQKSQ